MSALSASKLPDGVRVDWPEAHLPRWRSLAAWRVPVSRRLASSRLLQPCSLACYKSPSVTTLSSAATTTREKGGK
jgi:hypothetical protein